MTQYINKSALVEEIEKLQLCTMDEHMNYYSAEAQGEYNALSKLESFLDTLEVKEIGVDFGDPKGDKSMQCIIDTKTLEVKEVDLEKELEKLDNILYDLDGVAIKGATCYLTVEDVKCIAKRFFELGLTQKRE